MNTSNLITLLRTEIEKTGYKCCSPDLPQTDEICSSVTLGNGSSQSSLPKNILYSDISFYILVRGTSNDKDTRKLADDIFNQLHMKENIVLNGARIILILCQTPNYAFRDENQRIHYNINCKCKVEWRNEESTKVQ